MSNLTDIVGNKSLANLRDSYEFVDDRFQNSKSALNIKNGSLELQIKNIINDAFTIMIWIKLKDLRNQTEIFFVKEEQYLIKIFFDYKILKFQSNNENINPIPSYMLNYLNEWFQLVFTLNDRKRYLYLNGQLVSDKILPINNLRTKDGYTLIGVSNTIIDDLKIYTGVFTSKQILEEYYSTKGFETKGFYLHEKLVNPKNLKSLGLILIAILIALMIMIPIILSISNFFLLNYYYI